MPAPGQRTKPRGPVAAVEQAHRDGAEALGRVAILLAKRRLSRQVLRDTVNTLRRVAAALEAVEQDRAGQAQPYTGR